MEARQRPKGEQSVAAICDSGRNVASFSMVRVNPFKIHRVFRPARCGRHFTEEERAKLVRELATARDSHKHAAARLKTKIRAVSDTRKDERSRTSQLALVGCPTAVTNSIGMRTVPACSQVLPLATDFASGGPCPLHQDYHPQGKFANARILHAPTRHRCDPVGTLLPCGPYIHLSGFTATSEQEACCGSRRFETTWPPSKKDGGNWDFVG